MKKLILLSAAVCSLATASFATKHTITTSNFMFAPSTGVTVALGDTVEWVLAGGTHTSTSTTIPSGAAPWDQNLSSTTPFIYVPTVAGTYNYHCTIHSSMTGEFTVTGSTAGVNPVVSASLFKMFPNPATASVRLQFMKQGGAVSVVLTDMSGKTILTKEYASATDVNIDVKNVPAGIYVIAAQQDGRAYKEQLQIAH